MDAPLEKPPDEDRDRLTLRRTLSAISWLYAAWSATLSLMFLTAPPTGSGIHASRTLGKLMAAHAAILAGAGWTLWRPRRGAWVITFLAAGASLSLVVLDCLGRHWESAIWDGAYAFLAVALFLRCGPIA